MKPHEEVKHNEDPARVASFNCGSQLYYITHHKERSLTGLRRDREAVAFDIVFVISGEPKTIIGGQNPRNKADTDIKLAITKLT